MFKISRKASVTVSIVFAVVLTLCVIALLFLAPTIVRAVFATGVAIRPETFQSGTGHAIVLADTYLSLIAALAALLLLLKLIMNIRKSVIFTDGNVSIIREISWLCFLEGFTFLILSLRFAFAMIVAASAFFLGLVVRVVKNVIEEATAIKNENDLTV